jgi:hypothetical protein
LAFTCPKGNADSAPRGNKLSVPFQPPRPAGKTEFLRTTGFCQIWIPNYSLLAKPLYEATKQKEQEPLVWEEEQEKTFREINRALTNTPALSMLDVMKPFFMYIHE